MRGRAIVGISAASICGVLCACSKVGGLAGADPNATTILGPLFDTPTPTEVVAMAADEFNADHRQRGVLLLANAPWGGEDVYLQYYRKAIDDEDAGVRIASARALALHGEPEDVPLLIPYASDPSELLRWEVARALQRLHNPVAVPALLERLDLERMEKEVEASHRVRAASARALGQYPERRVVDRLIEAFEDPDLSVNIAARNSLRTLTGMDHGMDAAAWHNATRDLTSEALFAGRKPYTYPVYHRDPSWIEAINPFDQVPNEVAAPPVGMPPVAPVETGS